MDGVPFGMGIERIGEGWDEGRTLLCKCELLRKK
jgi:hypothetical protein